MIKPHRHWAIFLFASLVLLITSGPLATYLTQSATNKIRHLQEEKTNLFTQIRQWESDAIAASELGDSLESKEIEKYLAPTSRAALADRLELLAVASRLYHFTFSLAPSAPWQGNKDFPNFRDVVQSRLTFEADAPYDAALFRFLSALCENASRVEIQQITIRRLPPPLTARNLHIKADVLWLSNSEGTK